MRSKLAVSGEFAIQIHMFNKTEGEPHQQQLFPGLFVAAHLASNLSIITKCKQEHKITK